MVWSNFKIKEGESKDSLTLSFVLKSEDIQMVTSTRYHLPKEKKLNKTYNKFMSVKCGKTVLISTLPSNKNTNFRSVRMQHK